MSKRLAATVCTAIAVATAVAGCAVISSLFGNSRELTSFCGVGFGDQL